MATHVLTIAGRQVEIEVDDAEPVPSAEEAAWQTDIAEGIGDPRDAELAARVQAMDMNAYAAFRRQVGIGQQSTLDFLSGH